MHSLSINQAWEESSRFLARESRLVAPVALALLAVPAFVQGWVNPSIPGQQAGTPFVGLIALLVTLAGQMAIARLAIGWSDSIGAVIGFAFRRLPVLIGSAMLVYVPALIVLVFALGVSLGTGNLEKIEQLSPQQLAQMPGVLVSVLAFAVLVVVLAARLFPSVAVAMSEKVGIVALIRRSWSLTRGHSWRILGLVLLLGVATLILSGSVKVVAGAVAVLIGGPIAPFSLSALIVALANGLVGALVGSVYAAMIGRVYSQLVVQPGVPDSTQG